jgi:hypothetical protein
MFEWLVSGYGSGFAGRVKDLLSGLGTERA